MFVVDANVLAVGLGSKSTALEELPIRLFIMDTGIEAVRCLREEEIDLVVSRWDLIDMPDGEFLENIRKARPLMPAVAFVKAGDYRNETIARGLGITAVLNDDVDDADFREVVCQLLGTERIAAIEAVEGYNVDLNDFV